MWQKWPRPFIQPNLAREMAGPFFGRRNGSPVPKNGYGWAAGRWRCSNLANYICMCRISQPFPTCSWFTFKNRKNDVPLTTR